MQLLYIVVYKSVELCFIDS